MCFGFSVISRFKLKNSTNVSLEEKLIKWSIEIANNSNMQENFKIAGQVNFLCKLLPIITWH